MASRIEEETLALRQSSLSQEMMAVQSSVEQVGDNGQTLDMF